MSSDEIFVFSGSGSPKLTESICRYLNIPEGKGEVIRFSEGNLFVRINEKAMDKIDRSPINKLLITDSMETQPVDLGPKIQVVSIAPLIGEAIKRIHNRESISILFDKP